MLQLQAPTHISCNTALGHHTCQGSPSLPRPASAHHRFIRRTFSPALPWYLLSLTTGTTSHYVQKDTDRLSTRDLRASDARRRPIPVTDALLPAASAAPRQGSVIGLAGESAIVVSEPRTCPALNPACALRGLENVSMRHQASAIEISTSGCLTTSMKFAIAMPYPSAFPSRLETCETYFRLALRTMACCQAAPRLFFIIQELESNRPWSLSSSARCQRISGRTGKTGSSCLIRRTPRFDTAVLGPTRSPSACYYASR
ncbi:hypothetical protein LIA77_09724 [Sarocladium implicatum]|nr:hypothetical protein LIA77_09724 [Sarocladium implicatum]